MKTRDLIEEAISLPLEERARMVDTLLESLNPADSEGARMWVELAQRRLAELRSGAVRAVPGDDVFAEIKERYNG